MNEYYSQKSNYVNASGIVTYISYNDDKSALYLGFSDLNPRFDDDSFKIVGDNLLIAQNNGVDKKSKSVTESILLPLQDISATDMYSRL